MADFLEVATLNQLVPGQGMTVTVRGVPVALFNVDGAVYAIDDTCRHAGVSLGAGELRGHILRCHAHGWRMT
jgi:nitrite reductase/ring-hydroxylating ferredoxin subunit